MTPSELINKVNAIKPSGFSVQTMLEFLLAVEQQIADEKPTYHKADCPYCADGVYTLPESAVVCEVYRDGVALLPVSDSSRLGYVEKEGSVIVQSPAFSTLTVYYTLPVPVFTLEDMDTRQLLLPEQWADIYVHYLSSQIELYSNNISMYANHAALFNQRFMEYVHKQYDNRPLGPYHRSRFCNIDS